MSTKSLPKYTIGTDTALHCSRGWRVVCLYVDTISLFEPSTQISPPINCFGWSWILDMDIAAKKCKMHFICQKKTTLPNSKNSRFTFKPLGSAEAEVTNTGCLLISRGWGSVKQSPGGVCRGSLHLLLLWEASQYQEQKQRYSGQGGVVVGIVVLASCFVIVTNSNTTLFS